MPTTQVTSVSSTVAFQSSGPDGATITVQNLGPDSCYYAVASTVSSGLNDGTLASGGTISFFPSKFFISAGTSKLAVTTALPGEQIRQYDKDNGQTGIYAPQGSLAGFAACTVAATRGYVLRVRPSRPMTITSIAFYVSTAASVDDPVDVGIFNSSLTTLLVSKGATSGLLNATGLKNVAITATTLQANTTYYPALSVGTVGGTAAVISGAAFGALGYYSLFGVAVPQIEADAKAATHPLAAPWGSLSGSTSVVAAVALRES